MFGIRTKISLLRTKMRWRGINGDNGTYPVSPIADLSNIEIGRYSYGPIDVHTSSIAPCLTIGSFCSIASDVVFVTHDEHPTDRFSTFPFKVMVLGEEGPEATSKGGIVLEDDVWVGYRATILDGVTIHRGGGCRRRCRRLQGRAAVYRRRRCPSEANQAEIRRCDDRAPHGVRLFQGRQVVDSRAYTTALLPARRARHAGASE